jgi:hypothetical protein
MTNRFYSSLTLFILLFSFAFDGFTQGKSDFAFRMYTGASFLPFKPEGVESSYYEDLSIGYNYGSDIIVFLSDVGLGFCYDKSNFSAKGRSLQNSSIDENYNLHYFGPLISSRITVNKEHHLIFSVSIGNSIAINNAIIDGNRARFRNNDWVQKFSFSYEYHFSDISFTAGLQFINENTPSTPWLLGIRSIGFFGSPTQTQYSYTSGIDLDRLSLNIGVTYHLNSLFK